MKSKHIPMSVEEFRLMEHSFGWKAEYFSGEGHLTPREHLVQTQLTLTPIAIAELRRTGNPHMAATQVGESGWILPVNPALAEQTIAAFLEAFEDSVEFCDWSVDEIRIHARKNITNYFQGVRGQPHPVSRMAIEPNSQQIVGLALFVENKQEQVELDLLLVKPSYQRMGIAITFTVD